LMLHAMVRRSLKRQPVSGFQSQKSRIRLGTPCKADTMLNASGHPALEGQTL